MTFIRHLPESSLSLTLASTQFSASQFNAATPGQITKLVVIDAGIEGYEELVAGLLPNQDLAVLHPSQDGIEQISYLLSQGRYTDLAIVAHGEPGKVYLGNSILQSSTLSRYTALLAEWGVEQIDLWSCQVAQNAAFVAQLTLITKANIFASPEQIGQGNWSMTGTEPPFQPDTQAAWMGLLAVPTNPSFEGVPNFTGWTIIPFTPVPGFDTTVTSTVAIGNTGGNILNEGNPPATNGARLARLTIRGTVPAGQSAFGNTLRSSTFALTAGQTIGLDFQPVEFPTNQDGDDAALRIFLFNEKGTPAATLIDGTFNGTPGWLTAAITAPAAGNYYLTIQNGSYDQTFGKKIRANVFVDNIRNTELTPSLTADIVDVTPDPRSTPVNSIAINFSTAINPASFSLEDLTLTRGSSTTNLLAGSGATISGGSPTSFTLNGLSGLTAAQGIYRLFLNTTGVNTTGDTPGFGNAFDSWEVTETPPLPTITAADGYFNFIQFTRAQGFTGKPIPFTPVEVNGLQIPLLFDETYYTWKNPDVAQAVSQGQFKSGYDHFIKFGQFEGRNPSTLYNEQYYLSNNPDVAQAVQNGSFRDGFQHFLLFGNREERNPGALFNQQDYLTRNPDVQTAVTAGAFTSAFDHYIEFGAPEGRIPELILFEEAFYLKQNPDVRTAVQNGQFIDGYQHYLQFGALEGRNSGPLFSESGYKLLNPDVAAAIPGSFPNGLSHYLLFGRAEGRATQNVAV